MNKRLTFRLVGYVLLVEAALMALPLIVSLIMRDGAVRALLISMAITAAAGGLLSLMKPRNDNLRAREGFAVVALSWILLSLFGALPFRIHGCIPKLVDAFFETASGFTTTGSTILTEVESLPKGLLFWRSFTHWVGGMGVLVLSLALLPKMGARSIYLMRAESPGPSTDKLVPKVGNNAKLLYWLYAGLSLAMLIALLCTGMNLFDALIHTFGAAGTGGFSNYNASVGHFNDPVIEMIIAVFMALFGVNFSFYYYMLWKYRKQGRLKARDLSVLDSQLHRRRHSPIPGGSEVVLYLAIIAGATVVIAVNLSRSMGYEAATSLRYSFFQVSSIITTTGYGTADFNLWPQLSRTILVGLMLVGACAGSTGGGLKVVRVQLLVKSMMREVRKTIHPKSINTVKLDGHTVDESTLTGVYGFFIAYIVILMLGTLIISLDGFSFETNLTAVISTLSNIGPGLDVVGPTGNFAGYSDLSTFVLSICMLIGRLEIFPILMLLAPSAWDRY